MKDRQADPLSDERAPASRSEPLTVEELLRLFTHFDQIHAAKENLFVPLSLAIFPAVLLAWRDIRPVGVVLGGAASVGLYVYHVMVLRRFALIQQNLLGLISARRPELASALACPRQYSIALMRRLFLWLLLALWMGLIALRIFAH